MPEAIMPMKKVKINILAGSEEISFNFTPKPISFSFIYGVHSDGLTPFEVAFEGREKGDTLKLTVASADARGFFAGFYHQLTTQLAMTIVPKNIYLEMEILEVSDPANLEIVKALADSISHGGCGGSCGCGC